MTKTPGKILVGVGIALFVVLLGLTIWSLFRPAVKEGPWPPTRVTADAGRD